MQSKRGCKKDKKSPACANMVKLYDDEDYTVYWKGRAAPRRQGATKASRPRPRKWANLVVFLNDVTKRKRSFHVGWNGQKFSDSPDFWLLKEQEAIFGDFCSELRQFNSRLIKGWEDW